MDTDYNLQELYERVGRNIAYLRKCKKLTQEEFAYHLNIHSQALVSQYEHAKKSLTLERIIEFCSFFEVPLEDMLFRDFLYIEQIKLSNNEVKTTTPIQKCAGNTYYGYYLKEQNKGCSEFSAVWRRASGGPRTTSPAHCPPDWTWAMARGLWIICIGYCRRMTNLVLYWDML